MTLNSLVNFCKTKMEFFILAIYAYVLFQVEDKDYITMLLLTVAACLSICFLKKGRVIEGVSTKVATTDADATAKKNADATAKKNADAVEAMKTVDGFATIEAFENPKPDKRLPDAMGPYDGLCLQTGNDQYWMKSPDETALVPNDALFTYLSSQGPTKPMFTDNSALYGPSIDGHPDSDKKMFMLANNRTSPACCPSTFSTSTGCVCTTKNQRDFIAARGSGLTNKSEGL
jgi:hypothetical protein